jgi:DNA-binding MarR family transcriptional regulator
MRKCVMHKEIRQLHHTLVDLVGLMNRPQRDTALLQEAGVSLDRALFPLLIVIGRKGPIGVVELAELVGRDYTTVSRQISKLDGLGLINRHPSKTDSRVREAVITAKGKEMTSAIDAARERMATVLFAKWRKRDLQDLARLMRRFADDFQSLPTLLTQGNELTPEGKRRAASLRQRISECPPKTKKAPSKALRMPLS